MVVIFQSFAAGDVDCTLSIGAGENDVGFFSVCMMLGRFKAVVVAISF